MLVPSSLWKTISLFKLEKDAVVNTKLAVNTKTGTKNIFLVILQNPENNPMAAADWQNEIVL